MGNIHFAEKRIVELIENLKQKDKIIPVTVETIPNIPFSKFEELRQAILSRKILIQRFVFEYLAWLFKILANPVEKFLSNFYIGLSFIGPIVSIILVFTHSWWWLFGIIVFPICMSKNKHLYNKVIYASAVNSEVIFCFLYYIRQISLTSIDYSTTYYWGQEDTRDAAVTSESEKVHGNQSDSNQDSIGNLTIQGTLKGLIEQDAEAISRGEIPETRLIPHHAIKRDVIIAAYSKDFRVAIEQINSMNWVEAEKARRISEIQLDFDKQIYGIKRLKWPELDKIIDLMKKTRTDFKEIENDVRAKNSMYKIVDPL